MAQKTRAQLDALIAANLPNNSTQLITPAQHREVEEDLTDSNVNVLDDVIETSAGAGSAGKLVKLAADGKFDASTLPADGSAAWGGITGTLSAQTDLSSALALKAPLASPALTGTPTSPTAAPGTNTTQLATTEFVLANGGASMPAFSSSRTVFVNAAGSDTTGDGTIAAPWLTLGKAITEINTAGNLAEATPYMIEIGGGNFAESITIPSHIYFRGAGAVSTILGVLQFTPDGTSHIYNGFMNVRFDGNVFITDATHRQMYFDNCGFGNVLVRDTGVVTPAAKFYNCYTHSTGQLKLVGSYDLFGCKAKLQIGDTSGGYTQQITVNMFACSTTETIIQEPDTGANNTTVRAFGCKLTGITLSGDDVNFLHDSSSVAEGITIASGSPNVENLDLLGGTGDVVGPASSTDNAFARYDSTTGKIIQDGVVVSDDSGNVSGVATQSAGDSSTKVATTAFVTTADNLKANLASPTFTGTPTLPTGSIGTTQSAGNSTTALATTAFVTTADNLKANLASPTFTGTPTLPTGTVAVTQASSDNSTKVATTNFVQLLRMGVNYMGGQVIATPADATTYYFGANSFSASTTADRYFRVNMLIAGTIKVCYMNFVSNGTLASGETSSVYIRLNNTTDTLVSAAVVNDANVYVASNVALSIAVVSGDYFEIKWITPTWATNPGTSIALQWSVYVE